MVMMMMMILFRLLGVDSSLTKNRSAHTHHGAARFYLEIDEMERGWVSGVRMNISNI